jgi:hypothetical protein
MDFAVNFSWSVFNQGQRMMNFQQENNLCLRTRLEAQKLRLQIKVTNMEPHASRTFQQTDINTFNCISYERIKYNLQTHLNQHTSGYP